MPKTQDLLQLAFAGESQTNRRYLAFAAKADQEGYPQVARLFRGAAASETVHAHNYLRALKGVRSTRENLQEALSVETAAYKERYPEMIKVAKEEGNKEAEIFFDTPWNQRGFTPNFCESCWIPWRLPRITIHTASVPVVAIRQKRNHPKPALCAGVRPGII